MQVRTSVGLLLLALVLCGATAAPAADRIAIVVSSDDAPFKEAVAGFSDALGRLGAHPAVELVNLGGDGAKAGPALRKVHDGGFRLIFAVGSLATESALAAGSAVPIVSGLVLRSDALKQGKNVTGVTLEFSPEVQLAWLQKLLPDVKTIGVVFNPSENGARVAAAVKIAEKMGLAIEAQEARSAGEVPAALERLAQRAQVLWGIPDSVSMSPAMARAVLLFSLQNSIPVVGPSVQWVKAGALLSLDTDYREVGIQCASMAFRVLNGEPPASIPVLSSRTVRYSLNMRTAGQLKIAIPDHIVRGAKQTF